jgi:hypothetical protein
LPIAFSAIFEPSSNPDFKEDTIGILSKLNGFGYYVFSSISDFSTGEKVFPSSEGISICPAPQ